MSKDPVIPETWGIPEAQANKVREALSKKSIRPEDRVQKAVEEIARDIAIIEPDPMDWGWWITYLVGQLEMEAETRRKRGGFSQMLEKIELVPNRK